MAGLKGESGREAYPVIPDFTALRRCQACGEDVVAPLVVQLDAEIKGSVLELADTVYGQENVLSTV